MQLPKKFGWRDSTEEAAVKTSQSWISSRVLIVLSFSFLLVACGGGSYSSGGGGCGNNCPPPPTPAFVFVSMADPVYNSVWSFTTGVAGAEPESAQLGPQNSIGMVADPAGKFLYVSDFNNGVVDVYSINSTSGAINQVNAVVATNGSNLGGLAMDPQGKFLYATEQTLFKGVPRGNILAWSVDSSTGALQPINSVKYLQVGYRPAQIAIDSTGKFLYVSDPGVAFGWIFAYEINSDGTLTPVSGSPYSVGITTSVNPIGIVVSPNSKFLYVALNGVNAAAAYAIDGTTGALSPVAGMPFACGLNPILLAIHPNGNFLYAGNTGGGVSAFTIDQNTGILSPVLQSPFDAGSSIWGLAVDPSGKYLYAADGGSSVLTFNIRSTGALTLANQVSGLPVPILLTVGK